MGGGRDQGQLPPLLPDFEGIEDYVQKQIETIFCSPLQDFLPSGPSAVPLFPHFPIDSFLAPNEGPSNLLQSGKTKFDPYLKTL